MSRWYKEDFESALTRFKQSVRLTPRLCLLVERFVVLAGFSYPSCIQGSGTSNTPTDQVDDGIALRRPGIFCPRSPGLR